LPAICDSGDARAAGRLKPGQRLHPPSPRVRQAAGWSGPLGGVPDAACLDQAGVDGGLLLGLTGIGQVGEEVRPLRIELAVESRIQPPDDLLAGVQLVCP
jgi:hypothetical protein